MTRVAVLGLGATGSRVARRRLDAGHELAVWNRTAGRADALVTAGARRAENPRAAAGAAEVVITMLADPDFVERWEPLLSTVGRPLPVGPLG